MQGHTQPLSRLVEDQPLPPATEHSRNGICTLAPKRPRQDVGICRACIEQGLFDALLAGESR